MRNKAWRIKNCSGLMSRANKIDPEEETCSVADSSIDDNRKNSRVDPYSNMNSSTGSEMLEIAIQTFLGETRARDLDREVYQGPDSDRYLMPAKQSSTTQPVI